ncbi:nucleoside deaminase [Acinetobacter pragensis]|uniref:nucleoside deaminase n=1 Tax=Acinetobacter pragensis TaxID=1806892 RepID=UPI00333F7F31
MNDADFLTQAVSLAKDNIEQGGRPFGAIIVKQGEVIAQGVNRILATGDPTSHAELNALRQACQKLKSVSLTGCSVYASGQPCPMCLAALRMAGVEKIVYAYSNDDAEPFGLSTAAIAGLLRQEPHIQDGLEFVQLQLNLPFELYALWKQHKFS